MRSGLDPAGPSVWRTRRSAPIWPISTGKRYVFLQLPQIWVLSKKQLNNFFTLILLRFLVVIRASFCEFYTSAKNPVICYRSQICRGGGGFEKFRKFPCVNHQNFRDSLTFFVVGSSWGKPSLQETRLWQLLSTERRRLWGKLENSKL